MTRADGCCGSSAGASWPLDGVRPARRLPVPVRRDRRRSRPDPRGLQAAGGLRPAAGERRARSGDGDRPGRRGEARQRGMGDQGHRSPRRSPQPGRRDDRRRWRHGPAPSCARSRAARIAQYLVATADKAPGLELLERSVNNVPGLVAMRAGAVMTVASFGVSDTGGVTRIWAVRNPEKLRPWARLRPSTSQTISSGVLGSSLPGASAGRPRGMPSEVRGMPSARSSEPTQLGGEYIAGDLVAELYPVLGIPREVDPQPDSAVGVIAGR
ncbi:RNA polymerase sigma24 factor [Streptomyces rapamycinicus NRRL 5491]|uniref:RNA polymerase sigma24 factor n=1 Tax=Streptomyces rapamycinicus (strain ATCC 29253 / DSM 41530 / NRRL 5491 / AYB-994) TaxID=1343740 RepID=A0A3L8QWL8_STRRN|nr:RNA polymerase sigma24 factor [Streptomyces rapamycinicus NRRL 5491]